MSPAESAIASLLSSKLSPTQLLVQDISGGCGSMYAIDITSPQFKGLSILKQQRLVNAALGDMVKEWHGVQIRTKVPSEN
ncbi:Altered inheritance of mitochondria protein 1 [Cladobotryum mycophilum]|uniref:Altered inheritance of mitochondria protein 1 n=1 Tax=Cladobotryum mycophilum TaxID=491253 RepID=A0ABR0SBW9_9HYPO